MNQTQAQMPPNQQPTQNPPMPQILPPKVAQKPVEKESLFNFPVIFVLPEQAKYIQKINQRKIPIAIAPKH